MEWDNDGGLMAIGNGGESEITEQRGRLALRKLSNIPLPEDFRLLHTSELRKLQSEVYKYCDRALSRSDGKLDDELDRAITYGDSLLSEIKEHLAFRQKMKYDDPEEFGRRNAEKSARVMGALLNRSQRPEEGRKIILRPGKLTWRDLFHGREGISLDRGGFQDFNEFAETIYSGRADNRLKEIRTFISGVGSLGGYAVPEEFTALMFDGSLESEIVRPRAVVVPMLSETKHLPAWDSADHTGSTLFGGLKGQWLSENTEGNIQTGKLRDMILKAGKLAIFAECSREAANDGLGLQEQIGTALIMSLGFNMDEAFLVGNGVGKPLGALSAGSTISVARAGAGAIAYADIVGMFARMHPACLRTAIWVASPTAIPQLAQVRDAGNNNLWIQSAAEGIPGTLFNLPILFSEKTPALGSTGDLMLVDFSKYVIGIRQEVSLEQSNAPGWTRDVQSFRAIVRVDGQPLWAEPVTPANGGDTLSWCVVLQ